MNKGCEFPMGVIILGIILVLLLGSKGNYLSTIFIVAFIGLAIALGAGLFI
jgi:hypothetical protein